MCWFLLFFFSFESLGVWVFPPILTAFRQTHKKEGQRCPSGLQFTEKDADCKNQRNKNITLTPTVNQKDLTEIQKQWQFPCNNIVNSCGNLEKMKTNVLVYEQCCDSLLR